MSKKLRNLKQKTRSAAKGGRNGQIFEKFVNAHNARIQSPSRAMAKSGADFADGFSCATEPALRKILTDD